MLNIAAVIVFWNNYPDTKQAVRSLVSQAGEGLNLNIYLVDNGSTDGSADQLEQAFAIDRIRFIHSEANGGFARGCNLGIKTALEDGHDHILLLNNDAILEADCLALLLGELTHHPDAGIIAPQIRYYHDRERIWQGGGYFSWIRGAAVVPDKGRHPRPAGRSTAVTFVSGCALLVRGEVFQNAGYFDEDFFLYYEDLEFCQRVIRSGFKIIYLPRARAYHKVSVSAGGWLSSLAVFHQSRSRIIFLRKIAGPAYLVYGLVLHFLLFLPFKVLQGAMNGRRVTEIVSNWLAGAMAGLVLRVGP